MGKKLYPEMTQDILKSHYDYDENRGLFTRKKSWGRFRAGDVASYVGGRGYVYVGILGYRILAHRLAWFYMHGVWPEHHIDHINGDKLDNRIVNLREATNAQNLWGCKIQERNSSGCKGVYWDKSRNLWSAKITVHRKVMSLGRFSDIKLAIKARENAEKKYYGEFSKC